MPTALLKLVSIIMRGWEISDVTVLEEFDVEHNKLLIVLNGYPLIHTMKPGGDCRGQMGSQH